MFDTHFTQQHAEQLARVDERTSKIEYDLNRLVEQLDRINTAHNDLVLRLAGTVMVSSTDHVFMLEQARWVAFVRGNLKWAFTALASAAGAIVYTVYSWLHSINWGMVKK